MVNMTHSREIESPSRAIPQELLHLFLGLEITRVSQADFSPHSVYFGMRNLPSCFELLASVLDNPVFVSTLVVHPGKCPRMESSQESSSVVRCFMAAFFVVVGDAKHE